MVLGMCIATAVLAQPAALGPAKPNAFRTDDGAYTTIAGEPFVDPYFVNKSLIVGMQAGLDLKDEIIAWQAWLLPKQRADGGFDRFCKTNNQWRACKKADADDSMAATTIQLLALAQERQWLDTPAKNAAMKATAKANVLLDALYNSKTGLYRVFPHTELYYLMDSAEVYDGFVATRQRQKASALAKAIGTQFFKDGRWEPSQPGYDVRQFYPHDLAPVYLWANGLIPAPRANAEAAGWLSHHGERWLNRKADPYAWGLVAWQLRQTAPAAAACWRAAIRSNPPAKDNWTVLDAAVDEALAKTGIGFTCATSGRPA